MWYWRCGTGPGWGKAHGVRAGWVFESIAGRPEPEGYATVYVRVAVQLRQDKAGTTYRQEGVLAERSKGRTSSSSQAARCGKEEPAGSGRTGHRRPVI